MCGTYTAQQVRTLFLLQRPFAKDNLTAIRRWPVRLTRCWLLQESWLPCEPWVVLRTIWSRSFNGLLVISHRVAVTLCWIVALSKTFELCTWPTAGFLLSWRWRCLALDRSYNSRTSRPGIATSLEVILSLSLCVSVFLSVSASLSLFLFLVVVLCFHEWSSKRNTVNI